MAYNETRAKRVRQKLEALPLGSLIEKKMFGGLAFLLHGKMCINVSGEKLMCRFDPTLEQEVQTKNGYLPMIMRGKKYKGYCYVMESGFKSEKDFDYWISICVRFNEKMFLKE